MGGTRKVIYFFSEGNDRLANASLVLPRLGGRASESTTFTTKLVHSVLGFQSNPALHSERDDDANDSRTMLSLILPGDPLSILVRHRLITASSEIGVTSNVRGQFRPIAEAS